MLSVRPFTNKDSGFIVEIWMEKSREYPDFFAPMSLDLLEGQVLGNPLFDAKGFLFVFDGDRPVGFIHAAFSPNPQGDDLSYETGILFSPIIRPGRGDREEIAETLILAGENYFRSHGTSRWYAGGYANGSPFYMGLYGRCNPEGIFVKDQFILETFYKLGYRLFAESRRFRLDLANFQSIISPKIYKASLKYIVRRIPCWKAPNWWTANIYRNFQTIEWNVFDRDNHTLFPELVAGALFHKMQKPIYSRFFPDHNATHFILDYIGVVEGALRQGIASFLLTTIFNELKADSVLSIVIDSILEAQDERLANFLLSLGFEETDLVQSLYKIA